MQLAPSAWTQYHQFVELSVDAFHANETLVSELAVMWRFVGVVGASLSPGAGGRLAAAEAVRTSASTSVDPANAAVRMDIAPPGGADSSRANTHRQGGRIAGDAGSAWPPCGEALMRASGVSPSGTSRAVARRLYIFWPGSASPAFAERLRRCLAFIRLSGTPSATIARLSPRRGLRAPANERQRAGPSSWNPGGTGGRWRN